MTHMGVDGSHATLCGVCTCKNIGLVFVNSIKQVTCKDCVRQFNKLLVEVGP